MFSAKLTAYLDSVTNSHTEWAREHSEQTLSDLVASGFARDSAIALLYTRYGWSISTQATRYELLGPGVIAETTEYVHTELEVPEKYIALTSIEGGVTLLDRESEEIFDVEYGEFEKLDNGELKALAKSQYEFIEWYFSDAE